MKHLSCLLTLLFLTACATAKPPADNPANLKTDEILLVGKVILLPQLADSELQYDNPARGKALFKVEASMEPFKDLIPAWGEGGVSEAWGGLFFLTVPRAATLYINGIYTLVTTSNPHADTFKFPVRGVIEVKPEQRAVYIGEIVISRNEFSNLERVQVQDGFDQANAEFAKKFTPMVLGKALLQVQR